MIPPFTADRLAERRARLPLRPYPLIYFAFAHCCLLLVGLSVGIDPRGIAGFFYHPRMVAMVHLVTLGWVTSSILGALYLILPMAFRVPLVRRRLDGWIAGLYITGVLGMVSHFWLDTPSGMLWAAGLVVVVLFLAVIRFLPAVTRSRAAAAVKLHFNFAFANLLIAGLLGMTAGLNKILPILPGGPLTGVLAHAHLAIFGWATLTVMAAGYRLIPMLLPAAVPTGPGVWVSAGLMEAGALSLAASILLAPTWIPFSAVLCTAGLAAFGYQLNWMRRKPRPAPVRRRRPDLGVLQIGMAFGYLTVAILLGVALASGGSAMWKIHGAMAYGVCLLLGFLGQMIVGVASRLVPWAAYLWAFGDGGFRKTPPSPHELPHRPVQWATLAAWMLAVPALGIGLTFDRIALVCAGGWFLVAAAFGGGLSLQLVLIRSRGEMQSDGGG